MKTLFPEIPVLNNGQIELRGLTEADAEALEERYFSPDGEAGGGGVGIGVGIVGGEAAAEREVLRRTSVNPGQSGGLGVVDGDFAFFDTDRTLADA